MMVERLNLSVVPPSLVPCLNSQRPSYRDFSPTSEECSELQGTSVPCLNNQQVSIQLGQSVTRDFSVASEPPASYKDFGSMPSELQGILIPFPKQAVTGDFSPIPRAIGNFSPVPKSVSCRVFQSHAQIRELQGILVSCLNQMVIGDFSPMSE